ncbi:TetR/AcrR family transcriptional regulator [Chungangia koreensis]|uniref:TetR/AcrR family transcriptional regulator n=1 Tax=Chungangia koreensis TaxID=752657 RepID=A0ABV8X7C3_9LACT
MAVNNKQEDILNAALKMFALRGYDGTTIPMIADEANVGAGTIYRYFENKQTLVNSLFQNSVRTFSDALRSDFPVEGDMRQKFAHIFRRMGEFAEQYTETLLFIDATAGSYYLDEKSNEMFQEFMSFIEHQLDIGKKEGKIRNMPSKAMISIVYGAFVQLFKVKCNGMLEATPELMKAVEESCWDAIRMH